MDLCGCVCIQLKALDSDGGLNGEVKYSLSDDVSASLLYIDERTGVLRLSRPLDRETTSQIQFTVWATDSGDDPKSASAEVCNVKYLLYLIKHQGLKKIKSESWICALMLGTAMYLSRKVPVTFLSVSDT